MAWFPLSAPKMVIVVRSDLKMGKGKMASQVAHAAVNCALMGNNSLLYNKDSIMMQWMLGGTKKVVLKCKSLDELEAIEEAALASGLTCSKVRDAGHTQLEPHTVTCLGIGPGTPDVVDKVTGHLPLL